MCRVFVLLLVAQFAVAEDPIRTRGIFRKLQINFGNPAPNMVSWGLDSGCVPHAFVMQPAKLMLA